MKRINKFLNAEEVSPADISHTEQNDGMLIEFIGSDVLGDQILGINIYLMCRRSSLYRKL